MRPRTRPPTDATAGDDAAATGDDDDVAAAVDEHAAALTGGEGAADTESPVEDNSGAVAEAEAHLDEVDLDQDRETLKKLQQDL